MPFLNFLKIFRFFSFDFRQNFDVRMHAEHARKCRKVEYLGRIEYDFQKSRVTGPWNHKISVSAKKVKKKFHACVPLIFSQPFGQFRRKISLK
jgi:hypothetical protein